MLRVNVSEWLAAASLVTGVLIPFITSRRQRKTNHLDYEVVHVNRVLPKGIENFPPGLRFVGDDTERLQNPYIVQVQVKNTGRLPVRAEQFKDPIRMNCNARPVGAPIITASSANKKRWSLRPRAVGPDNRRVVKGVVVRDGVEVAPDLMNAGDFLSMTTFIDGPPGEVNVACRYEGMDRAMEKIATGRIGATDALLIIAVACLLTPSAMTLLAATGQQDVSAGLLVAFWVIGLSLTAVSLAIRFIVNRKRTRGERW